MPGQFGTEHMRLRDLTRNLTFCMERAIDHLDEEVPVLKVVALD